MELYRNHIQNRAKSTIFFEEIYSVFGGFDGASKSKSALSIFRKFEFYQPLFLKILEFCESDLLTTKLWHVVIRWYVPGWEFLHNSFENLNFSFSVKHFIDSKSHGDSFHE